MQEVTCLSACVMSVNQGLLLQPTNQPTNHECLREISVARIILGTWAVSSS